jgi:hypothetical protein
MRQGIPAFSRQDTSRAVRGYSELLYSEHLFSLFAEVLGSPDYLEERDRENVDIQADFFDVTKRFHCASTEATLLRRGVYLTGVHLMGVHFMGVHLMGVHLLQACTSYSMYLAGVLS